MMYDVLIIGGGPAGLNAAMYAARKELKVGVIAELIGGQMTLTKDIDNYLGFPDIEAYELIQKMTDHAKKYPIDWITGRVDQLTRDEDGNYSAVTSDGETYRGQSAIIATGQRSRTLGIPGEEALTARGVSYCATCDGPFYRNKRVAIVGGGDSAVEAVIEMARIASEVHILIRSRLRATELLISKMQATGKVKEWHHYIPLEVIGDKKVSALKLKNTDTDEVAELPLDGVFVEIGGEPNTGFVPQELALSDNREVKVERDTSTNLPGLFAAGDNTDYPHRQVVIAAADGAKAALAAHDYLLHKA